MDAHSEHAPLVGVPVDLDAVRRTLRAHGVVFALVFGSSVTGRAHARSDVDLAVWGRAAINEWRLVGALPDVVDVLDLARAPDGLVGRVAMTGLVMLDDDPPSRIRWQAAARKRYLDEAIRRRQFRQDFVRAHSSAQVRADG